MPLTPTTVFYSNPAGNWATLSAALTAGGTTLTVATLPSGVSASSGASPPTQFTVLVDSELLMVTNTSGTSWTVTRGVDGTAAAAHVVNSVVTPVVIAPSLNAGASIGATADGLVYVDGTLIGSRHGVNLKPGSGVTLTGADNSALDAVDVTVAAAAGGGALTIQNQGGALAASSVLNFVGAGVSVTNNIATGANDVSIPGGGTTGGGDALSILVNTPTGQMSLQAAISELYARPLGFA